MSGSQPVEVTKYPAELEGQAKVDAVIDNNEITAIERKNEAKSKLGDERDELLKQAVRAEEVAAANRLGGSLYPSEGIGSIESQMVQSLSKQDLIQGLLKESNYLSPHPEDTKYLPTIDTFRRTIQMLVDSDPKSALREPKENTINAERKVLDVLPIVESATKYCQENGVELYEGRMQRALALGFNITEGLPSGKDRDEVKHFVEQKKGRHVGREDITFYEIGAYQLDKFFTEEKLEGEERIPYVMSYVAGAIANGSSEHVAQFARNWLAEVIPVSNLDQKFSGGSWQPSEAKQTLGLGYACTEGVRNTNSIFEGTTSSSGLVEVAEISNKLVGEIYASLGRRSRLDARKQFVGHSNQITYDQDVIKFPVPKLESI